MALLTRRRTTSARCPIHQERFGPTCTAVHETVDRQTITDHDRAAWLDRMAHVIETAAAAGQEVRDADARAREARATAALYRAARADDDADVDVDCG